MLANEDKFLTQVARELLDDRNIVVTRVRTARGSGGENITIYKKIGGEVLLDKSSSSLSVVSRRVSLVKRIIERSKQKNEHS